jgi:hypothetical protein
MLNMKVVEFFKLYNIVLGLRFRNSKFTTFKLHFETRMEFKLTLSFPS